MKDPHWYVVQESDTTMMTIAAALPGQLDENSGFFNQQSRF